MPLWERKVKRGSHPRRRGSNSRSFQPFITGRNPTHCAIEDAALDRAEWVVPPVGSLFLKYIWVEAESFACEHADCTTSTPCFWHGFYRVCSCLFAWSRSSERNFIWGGATVVLFVCWVASAQDSGIDAIRVFANSAFFFANVPDLQTHRGNWKTSVSIFWCHECSRALV